MPNFEYEDKHYAEGYTAVCGCDEAGRGPLCGPVVAAACILPPDLIIDGLNDSKKLSAKKRDALFDIITDKAVSFSIAEASVQEIDEYNILEATLLAMRRAIQALDVPADYALIDGNICRGFDIPAECVIHGDSISYSIAAASILAKVTRDKICDELDAMYPEYGISKNKGYGTKAHMDALRKFGASPIHRKQFIRFLDK